MSDDAPKMEALKAGLKHEARKLKLDFNQLKSGGFIKQTQKDLFTVRLRCPGGMLRPEQLQTAARIAEKYGRGQIHLSVRQSVEIPYVDYRHFDDVGKELAAVEWSVASCGPRIRVPTACAGCSYNPNGLTDTQALCAEVDRRFFGTETGHHKFKIAFSGCPIDCFRTREMDLGFQGMLEPELDEDLCNGCGLCVKGCEEDALVMEGELPRRDLDRCNFCGDCVKVCPVDAMLARRSGWLARVGGKHGKHPLFAYEVAQFLSEEQVCSLVEKTVDWYRENGEGRERIGVSIVRHGLGKYLEEVVKPLDLEAVEAPAARRRYWSGGNFYE
ncbi:MAG: 4Fe-4S binding protein [Dehalococcoidia bacterium]|nr:4Fe-4S binding protein [Dehalococcoidia bacterium]MDP6783298.1 4Fe-4S binding protein [Dehalococcoidia bacterium]